MADRTPIAVVDIGSNSIALLVVAPNDAGGVDVLFKLKDTARLRAHIGADGRLEQGALDRTVALLGDFRHQLDALGAQVRVVATAALRAATNADQLVERARERTGLDIEVISGQQEAELAWLGVLHGMGAVAGRVLCADVGGGSTELLLGEGGRTLHAVSVPLGALVVSQRWLGPDPVLPPAIALARRQVRAQLLPVLAPFRDQHQLSCVGTSGTIQRVARIGRVLAGLPADDLGTSWVQRSELDHVIGLLGAAPSLAQRLEIPGMDPARADGLLGGALIYEALSEELGLPAWRVSLEGLRMGVIAEVLERRGLWTRPV